MAICRIIESSWFQNQAGVRLRHRLTIPELPDTIYFFDFIEMGLAQTPRSLRHWHIWWLWLTGHFQHLLLSKAGVSVVVTLLLVRWVNSARRTQGVRFFSARMQQVRSALFSVLREISRAVQFRLIMHVQGTILEHATRLHYLYKMWARILTLSIQSTGARGVRRRQSHEGSCL